MWVPGSQPNSALITVGIAWSWWHSQTPQGALLCKRGGELQPILWDITQQ